MRFIGSATRGAHLRNGNLPAILGYHGIQHDTQALHQHVLMQIQKNKRIYPVHFNIYNAIHKTINLINKEINFFLASIS